MAVAAYFLFAFVVIVGSVALVMYVIFSDGGES